MPVEVTWHKISDQLLKSFWARHPEERRGLADISDHILVFHRGIKEVRNAGALLCRSCQLWQESLSFLHDEADCTVQVRAKGLFINEKIDLLTKYLIIDPLSTLLIKWAPTLREYAKQVELSWVSLLRTVLAGAAVESLIIWLLKCKHLYLVRIRSHTPSPQPQPC